MTSVIKTALISLALLGFADSREIVIGDGEYVFDWTISGDSITITATAATTGYVGFGLSRFGDMVGADFFIGGVDSTGTPYFGDYHGTQENGPPAEDAQNDIELISAEETATHTTVVFRRALNTGDNAHDLAYEDMTQYIVWSYGETDDLEYHGGNRGQRLLNMFTG